MIALAFIWSLFAQDKVGGWRRGGCSLNILIMFSHVSKWKIHNYVSRKLILGYRLFIGSTTRPRPVRPRPPVHPSGQGKTGTETVK